MKLSIRKLGLALALLLVLSTVARAAITEKYVTSAGAGAGDGSSLANARSWANMIADINLGTSAGLRYNVSGAIARTTTADAITGGGSATSPVIIRGYSGTTTGDGRQGRTNGNGALVTTNMPSLTYTTGSLAVSGSWVIVESLNITGAPSGALLSSGADGSVVGCVINNSSTNAAAIGLTTGGLRATIFDNDVTLSGGSGGTAAISAPNSPRLVCNRVKGGSADCIQVITSGVPLIQRNVIFRGVNGIKTFVTSISPFISDNTIANCTGDGINFITGGTNLQFVFGNLITDNGGYGINGVAAANAIWSGYNRLDRNTSGATNLATDSLAATSYGQNTTSTAQAAEYVNAAGDDYRLVASAPGIGLGWFAYCDVGALQKQLTAGSVDGGSTGNKFYTGD
jgi:hypothetical protein